MSDRDLFYLLLGAMMAGAIFALSLGMYERGVVFVIGIVSPIPFIVAIELFIRWLENAS